LDNIKLKIMMKKPALLFSFIITTSICFSQEIDEILENYYATYSTQSNKINSHGIQADDNNENYVYVTKNMDTLYLGNCSLGKMIYAVWKDDTEYTGPMPVIQMVSCQTIKNKKEQTDNSFSSGSIKLEEKNRKNSY